MHIYIDESGIFSNPANKENIASVVAAFAVPTSKKKELFTQFKKLTHHWRGKDGEVKGKNLDEAQIASVIRLLQKFDPLLELGIIDLGLHNDEEMTAFKLEQARRITANITDEHHPNVIKQANEIKIAFEQMSNQLFVQAFLMFRLIPRLLLHMIWYYARRMPEELQWFYWMVDAKEQCRTDFEHAWSTALNPIMGTQSAENPIVFVEGGDYTFFENKFEDRDNEFVRRVEQEKGLESGELVSAKLHEIISEHFAFQDSKFNVGLQIVDILANATQRALNRKLKVAGWRDLGRLLIHREPNPFQFVQIRVNNNGERTEVVRTPFYWVLKILKSRAKSLWLDAEGEARLDLINRDKNLLRMGPNNAESMIDLSKLP